MSHLMTTAELLTDLRARIQQHRAALHEVFLPLDMACLAWRPRPQDWSIVQCFEHLNLTHDYYHPKIAQALAMRRLANTDRSGYAPSFWGRIYMHFAFNPRYSFPTAEAITPQSVPQADVLDAYLARQDALEHTLTAAEPLDLRAACIPIERMVRFNLGDCLKILVYHDALHIGQARQVLVQARLHLARSV